MVYVKIKAAKIHQLISCGVKSETPLRLPIVLILMFSTGRSASLKGFTYTQGEADISALTMNWTVLPNDWYVLTKLAMTASTGTWP